MKLSIFTVKTEYVCSSTNRFRFVVGFGQYALGVQGEAWGWRVLLIWRHVCLHTKEYADEQ